MLRQTNAHKFKHISAEEKLLAKLKDKEDFFDLKWKNWQLVLEWLTTYKVKSIPCESNVSFTIVLYHFFVFIVQLLIVI